MGIANIAATNMEHLCKCPAHGYSQVQRWGDKSLGICKVECEGHTSTFYKGDRDCSSAVSDAWQEALVGTPYEGALNGSTYTGNMKKAFLDSGLFEWKPMSFTAQRGDVYLKEGAHTAMCTSVEPDLLAEFSLSENGTVKGTPGDQTGRESSIHGYYNYPWDGILHYNGKADAAKPAEPAKPAPTSKRRIRVYTKEHGWLPWVNCHGCEDGDPDDFAGVPGCWIYGVEAEGCGTLTVERADGTTDGGFTRDTPITGIHLTDADYQAHWLGESPAWGKVEHNDDDDGAGKDSDSPLDMVRLLN